MAAPKHLVRRVEPNEPIFPRGTALDLEHTVETRHEDDEDRGAHGADGDGAPSPLQVVEAEQHQLPQRRLDEEEHHHPGLPPHQREQQLDHCPFLSPVAGDDHRKPQKLQQRRQRKWLMRSRRGKVYRLHVSCGFKSVEGSGEGQLCHDTWH